MQRMGAQHHVLLEVIENLLRDLLRGRGIAVGQYHKEFIAAIAGDFPPMAYQILHRVGYELQSLVACLMPERVVDAFEVVNVQKQHSHRCAGRGLKRGAQKGFPAGAGERVGQRVVLKLAW